MSENPFLLFLFVTANIAITAGYVFLAVRVIPMIRITLMRTKIGGIGFFLLCGLTHANMAYQALTESQMDVGHVATSWHMLAIHVPQAICVWLFVTGLYIEVGHWGMVRGRHRPPDPPPADDATSAEGT